MISRLVFAVCLMAATSANADVFEKCETAVAAQNQIGAKTASREILSGEGMHIPPEQVENVEKCLDLGWLEPHGFSKLRNKFVPLVQSQIENRRFEINDVERLRLEIEAEIESNREDRQAAVLARLLDACTQAYKSDPSETIMNKLCFDTFMTVGLPE